MNYFKEKKIAYWIILILTVLNISAMLIFWLFKPPFHGPHQHHKFPRKYIPDFVITELKLQPNQITAFDSLEHSHFIKTGPILDSLHFLKQALYSDAFQQSPDTKKIDSVIHQISNLESRLNHLIFIHLNELKKNCTPGQQQKLQELYLDMLEKSQPENLPPPPPPER